MKIDRKIEGDFNFNAGIKDASFAEVPQGQTRGLAQKPLLPGSTTVTEALADVFPDGQHVEGEIMSALVRGNTLALRTAHGFSAAARKTIDSLKRSKGRAAERAARELENLLVDTELLDTYRASLLET